MLVSFSVENWMSYKNKVDFSMVAGDEELSKERVSSIENYEIKVLPIAAIYGGNASGKTNIIKALSFVKEFVVDGNKPDNLIDTQPFLLNQESNAGPTKFCTQVVVDSVIYEFSFMVNHESVLEEKLIKISSGGEEILYCRENDHLKPAESFEENEKKSLIDICEKTRLNQLFLTASVFWNHKKFKPIYDWFRDTLVIIYPDSKFTPIENFFDVRHPLHSDMNSILPLLDTGISELGGKEILFEDLPFSPDYIKQMQGTLREEETRRYGDIIITKENGKLIAKRLVTYHTAEDGTKIQFKITQESDGTQRVIDLLPAFLEISKPNSERVYVIDELDRSMHTHLTRKLIGSYLSNCTSSNRSQLLFTTHDSLLMDANLLRNDEMWLAERSSMGVSKLYSVCEFKEAQDDSDLKQSYLQGRMGGIANLPFANLFYFPENKD